MVMHQPNWAHMASELAIISLSFWISVCALGLFLDRRRGPTDPIKIKKDKVNLRWAFLIFFVTIGQIVAEGYSKAFDWPHQTSVRTWIIAYCAFIGPGLLALKMRFDKKPTKPKPSRQEQQPYYTAGRTKR